MPLSVFIEMTLSAILTVWSPGPNNILLLSTASKYGISGNIRFMTGIWSGSLTLMCLSGLFCSTLGKNHSRDPAGYEIFWRSLCTLSCLADLAQDSALWQCPGQKANLVDGIFPAADKCKDHHLWADHVFRLYSAL